MNRNLTEEDKNLSVLIADDDVDDWYFAELAFRETGIRHSVKFVINGEELMQYLKNVSETDLPHLILLDLNMPRKDGREALKEIRQDQRFQNLAIAIFSTTISEEDRRYTSNLGAFR